MPSDSNGVYSLPSGYLAVTGETIQASQHNPVLEDLESATSARLMRSGVAPMTGPLKIADGSVGSPAIKFSSDGTSGIYKTTDGIGVSINGTKVAEFTSSGLSRMIGELIPWTLLTAPAGWVLPYGQTLSRTTYADLWTIAQTEIAAGNLFYNNGNGTTTFGIGDLRGFVVAGKDNMGGVAATRLTLAVSGVDGTKLGYGAGAQSNTLARANLPNVSTTFTGTFATITSTSTGSNIIQGGIANTNFLAGSGGSAMTALAANSVVASTVTSQGNYTPTGTNSSINGGVTQTAMSITQPTLVCNYILFVGA